MKWTVKGTTLNFCFCTLYFLNPHKNKARKQAILETAISQYKVIVKIKATEDKNFFVGFSILRQFHGCMSLLNKQHMENISGSMKIRKLIKYLAFWMFTVRILMGAIM